MPRATTATVKRRHRRRAPRHPQDEGDTLRDLLARAAAAAPEGSPVRRWLERLAGGETNGIEATTHNQEAQP